MMLNTQTYEVSKLHATTFLAGAKRFHSMGIIDHLLFEDEFVKVKYICPHADDGSSPMANP
jgi:hypothetical protein